MKALNLIDNILSFLFSQRQSGTTSLLKKIAKENDVWVLVADEVQKKEFGDKAVSIEDLKMGIPNKPILFDNYTIMKLTSLSQSEILNLLEKVRRRDELIDDIYQKTKKFKELVR